VTEKPRLKGRRFTYSAALENLRLRKTMRRRAISAAPLALLARRQTEWRWKQSRANHSLVNFSLFCRENTGKSARKSLSRVHIDQGSPTWSAPGGEIPALL